MMAVWGYDSIFGFVFGSVGDNHSWQLDRIWARYVNWVHLHMFANEREDHAGLAGKQV